jgi:hypothetical protein
MKQTKVWNKDGRGGEHFMQYTSPQTKSMKTNPLDEWTVLWNYFLPTAKAICGIRE